MSKLIASFKIPLTQPLFVFSDRRRKIIYKVNVDTFEVDIDLTPEPWPTHDLESGSIFCIFGIEMRISKDLAEVIPNDLEKKADFFSEHAGAFSKTAHVITNRIISYFKYRLHQPLLEEISEYKNFFLLPTWYDENDNKIEPGSFHFTVEEPAGLESNDYGITSFSVQRKQDLATALEKDTTAELYEEILADARSAIFQGNLRRAVLELAMACELAIKRIYFSKSSVAGLALEFMEDSQKMSPRVRIIDYISKIAEYALGEKFEDISNKDDFTNIDNLFRGRNKVVHSGELIFKDDNNKSHNINVIILRKWWRSVEKLLAWLNSKRSAN